MGEEEEKLNKLMNKSLSSRLSLLSEEKEENEKKLTKNTKNYFAFRRIIVASGAKEVKKHFWDFIFLRFSFSNLGTIWRM